ncbi:MAG: SDR family NAD(P)-dependent oxidoreductase, partial [Mycobacterium sp.]|nr:SDR family NAD(P)-dependent oxidoreductase [Mycobacterium sp.]
MPVSNRPGRGEVHANDWSRFAASGHVEEPAEDKSAVVTGGSSGIGLATAKRFVEEGATVFVQRRNRAQLA